MTERSTVALQRYDEKIIRMDRKMPAHCVQFSKNVARSHINRKVMIDDLFARSSVSATMRLPINKSNV